jgi:hypothetical protein
MRIAGRQFRPGVANTDDRFALKFAVRQALIFHPGPVDESVFALPPKPSPAAQHCRIFLHKYLMF